MIDSEMATTANEMFLAEWLRAAGNVSSGVAVVGKLFDAASFA
jgi:hypothetical protein